MFRKKALMVWLPVLLVLALAVYGGIQIYSPRGKHTYRIGHNRKVVLGDSGRSVGWAYNDPIPKDRKVRTIVFSFCCASDSVTFNEVIPGFKKYWKDKTGEDVRFVTGNGEPGFDAVATATIDGTPIQVAMVSQGTDVLNPRRGYSYTKWANSPNKGVVFSTASLMLVRKGNPLNIHSFTDLTRPGIKIIHANPYDAGSGLWTVYSIYGSALKETEAKKGKKDEDAAFEILKKVEQNTIAITGTAKDAGKLFTKGYGDVLLTSESKVGKILKSNKSFEVIVPPSTCGARWVIYKNDNNIPKENRDLVNGFIDWFFSGQAQEIYARNGFRPSDPEVLAKHKEFKRTDVFGVEYLGGATEAKKNVILDKWESLDAELGLIGRNINLPQGAPK